MISVLPWLVVVEMLAVAILPLTVRVFRGLPDRGFGVGRVLALVLVGGGCWLASMLGLTAYRPSTVVVLALGLAAVAWGTWGRACVGVVRARWRLLGLMEAIFVAVFGVGALIRAYTPDINGQEKFMDFAFMHALLRAPDLPAEDMWLAGYGLPYYYVSYLLMGLPAKVAGTFPPVAYNLAMAFVFAAGFAAATCIAYGLVAQCGGEHCIGGRYGDARGDDARASREGGAGERGACASVRGRGITFGVLGGLLVMVVGNLVGPLELIAAAGWGSPDFWQAVGVKGLAANASGGLLPADGGWWWRSSRVIPNIKPDGITEFPYFSFILGDLHPHYVAILLDLLIVALALDPWLRDEDGQDDVWAVVSAVVLATLVAASTWDVPTFWGLFLVAGVLDAWRRHRDRDTLRARLPNLLVPVVGAFGLIAPYFVGYQSQRLGVGLVAERTPLTSMLILFGPALAATALLAVWLLRRPAAPSGEPASDAAGRAGEPASDVAVRAGEPASGAGVPSGESGRRDVGATPGGLGALGLAVLAFSASGEPTLALLAALGILLGWAGWRLLGPDHRPVVPEPGAPIFIWLLAAYAVLILVAVELVFLRDVFGSRMNTVFKFQYQAWLLLGVAAAATLGTIWNAEGERGRRRAVAWRGAVASVLVVALAGGLVYPLAATWTKSGELRVQPTLDGERFLQRASPGDQRAIEWLRESVTGRPVIVEAVGGSYQEFARVSTFSGLPTVLGWAGHELQWRGEQPDYGRRERDVDTMYRAESRDDILRVARRYNARYLFFGSLELAKYGPDAKVRLDGLLSSAFSRNGTTIYALQSEGDGLP